MNRSATSGLARYALAIAWSAAAALALAVLSGASVRAAPQPEIEALRLKAEDLPGEWSITREAEGQVDQLRAFEARLGAKITAIVSQLLESEAGKVQINYVAFLLPKEMPQAYAAMHRLSGGRMTLLAKGRVALEIGATSEELKATVTTWFALGPVQRVKIKQHQVSRDWHLQQESLLSEAERQVLKDRLGIEVAEGLRQVIRTRSGAGLVIGLYLPAARSDAGRLQGALLRNGDLSSKLFQLDGCVAEVSSQDARARDEAVALLEQNAEAARKQAAEDSAAGEEKPTGDAETE